MSNEEATCPTARGQARPFFHGPTASGDMLFPLHYLDVLQVDGRGYVDDVLDAGPRGCARPMRRSLVSTSWLVMDVLQTSERLMRIIRCEPL